MPLERAHIEAADRLWNRLDDLRRTDRSLASLQGSLSTFDPESTLLKVLALHSLDTSKTHVAHPLAREISELLRGIDPFRCGIDVVESLAAVADRHGKSSYDGLGFASRFAHYFVDSERFPVLDAWSERALEALLGGDLIGTPEDGCYTRFVLSFVRVAEPLALDRRRRLGRWLWLAGQYAAWRANGRTAISRAVRLVFESGAPELERLLPPELCVRVAKRAATAAPASACEPPPALPSRTSADVRRAPDLTSVLDPTK